MTIDRQEVIAWAESMERMYGTELSPSDRDYELALAILEADQYWLLKNDE